MDLSKLIHGFLNSCYIGLSKLIDCYMDLKKMLHGFATVFSVFLVLCRTKPCGSLTRISELVEVSALNSSC